jgi:Bacterial regulatory proteins, luxR family
MALVVSGLLNKQVGGELGISEITVKAHRGQVMRKMKADSLADLVTMAARLGYALFRNTEFEPTTPKPSLRRRDGTPVHTWMCVDTRHRNRAADLCQNCVTYPPKPWGNTVIYGDTSTHIDVAEVIESEVRWWGFVCVSTRERNQFPSVLDRPLRHLSAFRINGLRAVRI